MKIKCKFFGLPEVQKMVGGKEIEVEIEGHTLGALQQHLTTIYGESIQKAFASQILKNGSEWVNTKDDKHPLKDGDHLSFLLMIPGG